MRPPIIACITLLLASAAADGAVAVLHPDLANQRLDRDRVAGMLMGRISTWSDGTPVVVVLMDGQAAVADLTGREVPRLLRAWKRLVFSGSATMPTQVASIGDVVRQCMAARGAIAILDQPPTDPGTALVITLADPAP